MKEVHYTAMIWRVFSNHMGISNNSKTRLNYLYGTAMQWCECDVAWKKLHNDWDAHGKYTDIFFSLFKKHI